MFITLLKLSKTKRQMQAVTYRLVVKLSIDWRLNQVIKVSPNDTSGHSVVSFGQSKIPYGQSDPLRLSFSKYLALSSGRNDFM